MDTIDVSAKYLRLRIDTPRKVATQTNVFPLGERILESLSVLFPLGHAGLTGLRVNYNGVAVLPWNQPTQFVVGDNERLTFEMGLYVSAPLSIVSVNNDNVAHSLYLTAKLRELGAAAQPIAPDVGAVIL